MGAVVPGTVTQIHACFPTTKVSPIWLPLVGSIDSFKETGIWPVILGREAGHYVEIPFGHHRKEAWERTLKPADEIEINIMSLSDTDMIKMMAHENLEEWGTSAIVEIETVAAVVKAYAAGKIKLNGLPEKTNKGITRYAPSFIPGLASDSLSEAHPYTRKQTAPRSTAITCKPEGILKRSAVPTRQP